MPTEQFHWDMNEDGAFTISDVEAWFPVLWEWVVWIFFLPGDWLIDFMIEHELLSWIAKFFEMGPDWHGGFVSGFVSAMVWLFGLLVTAGIVFEVFEVGESFKDGQTTRWGLLMSLGGLFIFVILLIYGVSILLAEV